MDLLRKNQPWSFLIVFLVLVGAYLHTFASPPNFPVGQTLLIAHGASVSDIAKELGDAHVIQQPLVLEFILRASGVSDQTQEGAYLFDTRENVFTIAHRLATGDYHLPPAYLTFPEGVTVNDIAEKVSAALPLISAQSIIATGTPQEGYLFPDTYLFPPDATADTIVEKMRANFNLKIAPLLPAVATSTHSLSDIIIMASLIEKEAQSDTDKHLVAGILWNRIKLGMPLQVDADHDETYERAGLPPAPICNPGLASILAALYPTKTKYLYYLSDKNGVIHYATTYAEQQANEAKYLD